LAGVQRQAAGEIPAVVARIWMVGLQGAVMGSFQQAAIKVEKEGEFRQLRTAIERAFLPEAAERFLKLLDRANIRIRDFDGILAARALEEAVKPVESATGAWKLYQALTVSDQAQIREFYLSRIEEMDADLRHKFKKLYQYY
jgi:hypothetical protein